MDGLTDDQQQEVIVHEAALAIGAWFEAAPALLKRQVYMLTLDDLKCLATAAIGQAALTRARLVSQERDLSLEGSILA
jgi:hypothetical protein